MTQIKERIWIGSQEVDADEIVAFFRVYGQGSYKYTGQHDELAVLMPLEDSTSEPTTIPMIFAAAAFSWLNNQKSKGAIVSSDDNTFTLHYNTEDLQLDKGFVTTDAADRSLRWDSLLYMLTHDLIFHSSY